MILTINLLFNYLFTLLLIFSNPNDDKLGVELGGRLLIGTHLDKSNYLTNEKQGTINRYDLDYV
jgi:hypothetical protein